MAKSTSKKPLSPTEKLLKKFGITEQISSGLGYNPKTKTWYGWSHRAIAGFKVGTEVTKGSVLEGKYKAGYKAKTIADAKKNGNCIFRFS